MLDSVKTIKYKNAEKGFSLIELMIVLVIISIMSTVAIMYFSAAKKLYKADEQSLKIVDLLQEAKQSALTKRTTMRVQLDTSDNVVRLIDENNSSVEADHRVIKTVALEDVSDVRINSRPSNVTDTPTESSPAPAAVFAPTNYALSPAHTVWTVRFRTTGKAVSATDDEVPVGATIYIWKPKDGSTTDSEVARAITIIGFSGAIRVWEYRPDNGSYIWADSRRTAY